MYSVFLVDDEPIVLEGIRSKINWEEAGFTFALPVPSRASPSIWQRERTPPVQLSISAMASWSFLESGSG